jgi:hypothetical protein
VPSEYARHFALRCFYFEGNFQMAITVPSWDVVPYNLQAQIANLNTLITNATIALNGPLVQSLQTQYYNTQLQLVLSLLGTGAITPATVISTLTYGTPNADGPLNFGTSSQGPNAGTSAGGLI